MESQPKRTAQINVKLSEEDIKLIHRAADRLWPGAVLSNAGILLGLARRAAKEILESKPKK